MAFLGAKKALAQADWHCFNSCHTLSLVGHWKFKLEHDAVGEQNPETVDMLNVPFTTETQPSQLVQIVHGPHSNLSSKVVPPPVEPCNSPYLGIHWHHGQPLRRPNMPGAWVSLICLQLCVKGLGDVCIYNIHMDIIRHYQTLLQKYRKNPITVYI